MALDVVSTMSAGDAASGQALRAQVDSGPAQADASIATGFALYLIDCVDVSAYAGRQLHHRRRLGNCPWWFAVQFKGADGGTSVTAGVPVAAGMTVSGFSDAGAAGGAPELGGMQWEVDIPNDQSGGCTADFTLDDIQLVSKSYGGPRVRSDHRARPRSR